MPTYRLPVRVTYTEYYVTEADSPEEAIDLFKEGYLTEYDEQEFYDSEYPEVHEVEEIER